MSEGNITKKAIAAAVKELTKEKPFDKISVGDIAKQCGLNRQTIYYHFQDKYELLSWIYYSEAFLPIMEGITFENWPERIFQVLTLMKEEKYFYINTIKHSQDYFQDYIMKIGETIIGEAIEVIDTMHHISDGDREFISQFYAYGVCGSIVQWATTGMKMSPGEMSDHMKNFALASEQVATTGALTKAFENTVE